MDVTIERALYRRDRDEAPRLVARSPGVAEELLEPLVEALTGFGERPAGIACPGAIFAQPLGVAHVAVVHVADGNPGPSGWASLVYSVMMLAAGDYDLLGGDPFTLVLRFPQINDAPLDALSLPAKPLVVRGIDQIRDILKRVKANALSDDHDPNKPPPLTVDNAESPTLLGGAQILVDGGKLIFERPRPDASMVQALWTLLPHSLRPRLWPASFAFTNELGFDVLVVPKLDAIPLEGYTTEEQAGDYPQGSYELALQTAAEAGDARDLEAVFQRRTSNDTLRLAVKLLVGLCLIVVAIRVLAPDPPPAPPVDVAARAAAAASIVGVRDPWTVLPMIGVGSHHYLKR